MTRYASITSLIAELRHECAASEMHKHDGCGCSESDLLQRAGYRLIPPGGIDAETVERCASILDDYAQHFNRLRDPGMANHDRAHAKRIRALAEPEPEPAGRAALKEHEG